MRGYRQFFQGGGGLIVYTKGESKAYLLYFFNFFWGGGADPPQNPNIKYVDQKEYIIELIKRPCY